MGWKSFLYIYWIYDIDVFSSPHYLGPEIGRQMMPYDYMLITRFRVTWQQWLEKTKYRYYNEDSISVFEFSDVWFRRNIEYKTATFFQVVVCVLELVGEWLPVIIHLQFPLESSDNNDLKRQNIDFVMRIPYLFSNFCSDLWFRHNIEYTTATFILPPPPLSQSASGSGLDFPPPLWPEPEADRDTPPSLAILCSSKIHH
jgi:hypothetical protein